MEDDFPEYCPTSAVVSPGRAEARVTRPRPSLELSIAKGMSSSSAGGWNKYNNALELDCRTTVSNKYKTKFCLEVD